MAEQEWKDIAMPMFCWNWRTAPHLLMESETMTKAVWFARWHITGGLVWLALKIAPKGAARDLLLSYIGAYSREVMQTISDAKAPPHET